MKMLTITQIRELGIKGQVEMMVELKNELFGKEVKEKMGQLDPTLKPGVDYSLDYMGKEEMAPLSNRVYYLQSALYTIKNNENYEGDNNA